MVDLAELRTLPWGPFFLALYLASSGIRKGSLSVSGGLTAFTVGFAMMAVPLRTFGGSLIVFYLIGSRVTKEGKVEKMLLEDGHQAAGRRRAMQVICNSLSAFVASMIWCAMFVPNSFAAYLLSNYVAPRTPMDLDAWCPVSQDVADGWSRILIYAAAGHFACCLGDTMASELGILSKTPPRLITTWKVVPPGTNGGVTWLGLKHSFMGGFWIGLTYIAGLYLESSACRREWRSLMTISGWAALGGLFGSLVDSLLGATVQQTRFSAWGHRILTDESKPGPDVEIKIISGIDILSNNQVNLVSSILSALFVAFIGSIKES